MKLTFICGSLEPGADGVGDYTRLLAGEISRRGHSCQLLALNDFKIPPDADSIISQDDDGMPVVRLSPRLSWTARLREARKAVDAFGPDWVSLQFVCFAFHQKGLIGKLGGRLLPLRENRRMHLMFHELWLGGESDDSLKFRLWGRLQRGGISRLLRILKPDIISTHASNYLARLDRLGIPARKLQLFGNIPNVPGDAWPLLQSRAREQGLDFSATPREKLWLGGIFGLVHPEWKTEPLFTHLKEAAQRSGKRWVIVAFGDNKKADGWWENLGRQYAPELSIISLGRQPIETVSAILQALDFGFATSPWRLIEKSSSATAMLEYGLPVIVSRIENAQEVHTQAQGPFAGQLIPMDDNLSKRLPILGKKEPKFLLPEVTDEFLQSLGQNANPGL